MILVKKLILLSVLLAVLAGVDVNAQSVSTSTSAHVTSSDGQMTANYNWKASKNKVAKKSNQLSQNQQGLKAPSLPSLKNKPNPGKEKSSAPKAPKAPREPRAKVAPTSKMYVAVNGINSSFSLDGLNYGLTIGKTGKVGWYTALTTNLGFSFIPDYLPSATQGLYYPYFGSGGARTLSFSGETVSSAASLVAGASLNIFGPANIYAGVGALYSETMLLTDYGSTVRAAGADMALLLDAGLLFNFGPVVVFAGAMYSPLMIIANTESTPGLGYKVGLGIAF